MGNMLNMRDVPESEIAEGGKIPFDGAVLDMEKEYEALAIELNVKKPIEIKELDSYHKGFRYKIGKYRGKPSRLTRVLGAAGEESLVPEQKLKIMSDHYTHETRTALSDLGHTDPVMAPGVLFRINSIFEDGYDLEFRLAIEHDPQTGKKLDETQSQASLAAAAAPYMQHLLKLITWKNDKGLNQLPQDLEGVGVVQGKAAALISPGILDLLPAQLPHMVEIITADDLGDPIIDVGSTRQLVACVLDMDDKEIARADELIYTTRGLKGLRRESKFHGNSPFEPILIISKAIKRFYNLDAPLAMIAAYITRQLIKTKNEGDSTELETRISTFMTEIFKASTWAAAMPDWYDGVDAIQPKVDWPMFDGVESKLANVMLAQIGVPKSTQNRELNLNRDLATIQLIQFVRFVRKPAEKDLSTALENQLWNPLLAHLAAKPLSEIPVRIKMVRSKPDGKDIDQLYDQAAQDKSEEVTAGNLMQNQTQAPLGASGPLNVRENKDGSFTVTPIAGN